MAQFDWLVVGAGFSGAVAAERLASQAGRKVLVIDRRAHLAGNAYESPDASGVIVQRYGPHIFHTSSPQVVRYLSQFTGWRPYRHRVLAQLDGKRVPVPFNLTSLELCFGPAEAARLAARLKSTYGEGARVALRRLLEAGDGELRRLAEFIYERLFLHYSTKQWGLRPEQLDPAVLARVPVVVSHEDGYFADSFQAMPEAGFNRLIERVLAHPNIELRLNTRFDEVEAGASFNRVVYTGPLDEFFGSVHGALGYRTMRFEFEPRPVERCQEVAVINYPDESPYTRIAESKHLTGQTHPTTTLTLEYPMAHSPGLTEPYYPIPTAESEALAERYRKEALKLAPAVHFAGRLAEYRYFNMDQAVANALALVERLRQSGTA